MEIQNRLKHFKIGKLASILKQNSVIQSGLILIAVASSSFIGGFLVVSQRLVTNMDSSQIELCRKLNRGEIQAIDVLSATQIPGTHDKLDELQKLQVQIAKERVNFADDHPAILQLKEKETALTSVLEKQVQNTCKTVKS